MFICPKIVQDLLTRKLPILFKSSTNRINLIQRYCLEFCKICFDVIYFYLYINDIPLSTFSNLLKFTRYAEFSTFYCSHKKLIHNLKPPTLPFLLDKYLSGCLFSIFPSFFVIHCFWKLSRNTLFRNWLFFPNRPFKNFLSIK